MLNNIKYIMIKNKNLIMIISIILICSVAIAFGVYAQFINKGASIGKNNVKPNDEFESLKSNFEEIFTNSINKEASANLNYNYNEIIYCKYNIEEEESGKYSINAKVPLLKGESESIQKINSEITDIFAREIVKILQETTVNTTYDLNYTAYVNSNIISLVIMCKYKIGSNPQRIIIQTYNYDVEKDKILTIDDIIEYKGLNKEEMQNAVVDEIKKVNKEKESIREQGYNIFVRNLEDDMYKIENTPNFFLGKSNYLYLVYAYGNNNYTSEKDLIIF